MENTEKREYRRHKIRLEIAINQSSEHNFFTGFALDVSEGGVFIATNDIKAIGSELEFSFRLDGRSIRVVGLVRWLREPDAFIGSLPPGMGIRFLEIDPEDLQRIQSFVEKQRESIFYED